MNGPKRILVVDDEEMNRDLIEALLEDFGHEAELAEGGEEALAKLNLDFDLVLLDVMMPGMDGFEVARHIRENPDTKDLPIIMVTALSDKEDRLRAVEAGANDFVAKPVDITELRVRMDSLLNMKEARDDLKGYMEKLEETVFDRMSDLREALVKMSDAQRKTNRAYLDTIERLGIAAEYKDEDTARHIFRMSNYCAVLARGMGLPPDEVQTILRASPMHDVGKIGIPDAILLKPGKLTGEECNVMKTHAEIGRRILDGSDSELLKAGAIIAILHHEKWDGSGYPKGIAGEEIPLWGRICAVADVFDALTSKRPYKDAFPNEKAYAILKESSGGHFDPGVVEVFFEHLEEILAIQDKHRDSLVK